MGRAGCRLRVGAVRGSARWLRRPGRGWAQLCWRCWAPRAPGRGRVLLCRRCWAPGAAGRWALAGAGRRGLGAWPRRAGQRERRIIAAFIAAECGESTSPPSTICISWPDPSGCSLCA
eukprot:5447479-Pyramimonas_sp.AAC.1